MPTSTLPILLALQAADAPARPGAAAPAATTAAPGAPAGAAPGAGAQPASGSAFMIMMLVLLGVMVAFSVVNARRDKKKRESLLASIKKHDKVLTIGGVMGTVVEVKDDVVVLKVDETSNTRITFTKGSISQVTATT
ncbi:MAG: preprotein translocase subunit YajC [Phycisphaerales bacterium]